MPLFVGGDSSGGGTTMSLVLTLSKRSGVGLGRKARFLVSEVEISREKCSKLHVWFGYSGFFKVRG